MSADAFHFQVSLIGSSGPATLNSPYPAGKGDWRTRLDTAGYNILLVYRAAEFPLRQSALDHLECFRRHSNARVFYCNLAAGRIPPWLLEVPWDLVVLHTIGLDRGSRPAFREMLDLAEPLSKVNAAKIALPQDEFTSKIGRAHV